MEYARSSIDFWALLVDVSQRGSDKCVPACITVSPRSYQSDIDMMTVEWAAMDFCVMPMF
jgi:hypothetical protein